MSADSAPTVLIWLPLWEYQCCGTPLTVGDAGALIVTHPDDPIPDEL